VARVKAVLRRSSRKDRGADRGSIEVGELRLDSERHELFVSGTILDLTPTEFRLMEVLLRAPGRAFRRDELIAHAFGDESDALDRTVDAHVKNLRAKLDRRGARGAAIQTVQGIGYKFCAAGSARDE
jgi:DNA-binding response OmpR family regulator